MDYDEEGRKLFKSLGLPDPVLELEKVNASKLNSFPDSATSLYQKYNAHITQSKDFLTPDVVYVHPVSKAKFYIGDECSAMNKQVLEKCSIFRIINAKGSSGQNYHDKDKRFQYLPFEGLFLR